jgi:hypothetical protein
LHNACSKVSFGEEKYSHFHGPLFWQGYLDIVRYLCESGGATSEVNGVPGVDVRSKGGWTPLSA